MQEIEVKGLSAGKLPLIYTVRNLFAPQIIIPPEEVAIGIDTSRWNGDMNYVTSKSVGTEFVYIKATQSISIVDSQFLNSRNKLTNFLPWGAYHFLSQSYSGIAQANFFCDTVGDNFGTKEPVLDVELSSVDSKIIKDFCERVYQRLGVLPMIYTNANYWGRVFGVDKTWVTQRCKLWVAHWGTLNPILPSGWTDYVVHQYSANGNNLGVYYGAPKPPLADYDMDLNRARKSWVGGEPPPPQENYMKVEVIVDSLNIRSGPSTSNTIIGRLYRGNQPEKLETRNIGSDIWIRIGWQQWAAMKYNNYVYMKDI